MLFNRILVNLTRLRQGEIKFREIPAKIINRVFNYSKLARHAKRSRFAVNEVTFRPIESNDKSGYLDFINSFCKEKLTKTEKEISIPKCNEDALCYVALRRNKIIGKIGLRKISSNSVNTWLIGGLSVLDDFRGYGIGEGLLKEGISAVEKEDGIIVLEVDKENKRALKLYKKLGFRLAGEQEKLRVRNIIKYSSNKIILVFKRI